MSPRPSRTAASLVLLASLLAGCGQPTPPPALPTVVEPTPRPTEIVVSTSGNLALGRPVTASASLVDDPPSDAVDGDSETVWNSGDDARQWIEIDLGEAFDLDRLVLVVAQYPEGETTHEIFGRGEAGGSLLLDEARGHTSDQQRLEISPSPAWQGVRYLKIETTQSPSWVAWRDIEVYGRVAAPAGPTAGGGPADIIFRNGHVLTMDAGRPSAQAVAVRGEFIAGIGTDAQVLAQAGPATLIIDLQGRTLTPGFIDAHSHRIAQRYKWGFEGADQAFQEALRQGWTGLTELAVDEAEWTELRDLSAAGLLPIRVDAYLLFNTFEGNPLPDWYNAYAPGEPYGPNLRAAGLKFFIDFNSGRQLFFDPASLADQLRARRAEGWQVAMKAIGAESHELALDAIELAEGGQDAQAARYRLEHSLAQTADQQARMARMGVIGSIQPGLIGVVAQWPDIQALTGEQGADNMSNWRRMADAGVRLAGSPFNPDGVSDEYTTDSHMSPMGVMYRGATQIGLAGRSPEPWMIKHALTVDEMLSALTIGAAYAAFQEDSRGSLAPGKLADLVVLSADPRDVEADGLLAIETLMTMVGGEIAWCAPGAEGLCSGAVVSGTESTSSGWPVLHVGSQGPEVAALQYLLRHHGHDLPADGQFGTVTEQAVRAFQSERGLPVDGAVGAQTWPALIQGVVLQVGSDGEAVRAAQHLLLEKFGYGDIVVDGLYGRVTESVVRAFQADHGLTPDGMIGPSQTWPALISVQP